MKCIFCKQSSEGSKSVEHIIPESLGNKSHTLAKGIVCDKCNNYFALKIEKEALDIPYFKSLRHRQYIVNKKNRLPPQSAFVGHPSGGSVQIVESHGKQLKVVVEDTAVFNLILEGKIKELYVPIHSLPPTDNIFLSRLLGKIALEALAERVQAAENWNNDLVYHADLDDLRNYTRYGAGKFWAYNVRLVYGEDDTLTGSDSGENGTQLLHEYDFLFIDEQYLFFVCIIMGIEYAINLAESRLSQYHDWLAKNDNKSPLDAEMQSRKLAMAKQRFGVGL